MVADDTQYRVVDWKTGNVLQTHDKLSTAKKACRALGYEETRFEGKAPIAFVQCDSYIHDGWDKNNNPVWKRVTNCCIYNPRFI